LYGRALFVERFDRQVVAGKGGTAQVQRHSQESLYALCGVSGFAGKLTHNEAIARLAKAAANPQEAVIEYLRRDLANIVLGNKDNHGRNTAVTRLAGGVALTPLFDFCPMYLHPDGIARRTRWVDAIGRLDSGNPDWVWVCKVAADALGIDERVIRDALKVTAEQIATLPREMKALGVDKDVMAFLQPVVEHNITTLGQL
jgi:serine/threonine-protein kinase HipA